MNGGPCGFNNAPVTRAFVIACALFTVFFGIEGRFIKLAFLSSWKSSILPGICGILAGSLYGLNFFCIRKAKFPESAASFFSRLCFPSTENPPAAPSRNVLGSAPSYAGLQVERNYPLPVPFTLEPREDSIAALVSMGFDRNSAGQALVQPRNDINVATNILLEAQSHQLNLKIAENVLDLDLFKSQNFIRIKI